MRGKHWLLLVLISLALLGAAFFFFLGSAISFFSGPSKKGEVAVVEILGGIFDAKPIVEQLTDLKKDKRVKAIVLRIDSPGGSVGASQEIFESVKEVKEKKPVVASMGTLAASGGYYIAAATNKIVANEGTITGSIGVRMELVNVEDLLQWAHLKAMTLKSGRFKDIGSPTRAITSEEKEYLEGVLKKLHDQFKKAVAENRGLSEQEIEDLADGRVFTGREAIEKKLVDEIGPLQRAIRIAGELAGIKGEPEFYYAAPKEKRFLDTLVNGLANRLFEKVIDTRLFPMSVLY